MPHVTVDLHPHARDERITRAHVYPTGETMRTTKQVYWTASLWTEDDRTACGFADAPKGHRTPRALLAELRACGITPELLPVA